jgi:hypothetical protein
MTVAAWIMFCVAPPAAIACIVWRRSLAAAGRNSTFRYLLADNARDVLVPLAVVAAAYAMLAWVVAGYDTDAMTIGAVRKLEERIRAIYQVTRSLKLGKLGTIGALTAFVVLGSYVRYRKWTVAAKGIAAGYAAFDRYQKTIKAAMVVGTALASYTFFAAETEVLGNRLQLRAKAADDNYHQLIGAVAVTIERNVSTKIAALVHELSPASYQATYSAWKHQWERKRQMARDYPALSARYRFFSQPAEEAASSFDRSIRRIGAVADEIAAGPSPPEPTDASTAAHIPAEAPPDATSNELRELGFVVGRPDDEAVPEALRAFDDPAAKKIIPALLGIVMDPKRVGVLGRLATEVPWFEPFLDVFKGAIVKYTGERATKRAHRLVDDALRGLRKRSDPADEIVQEVAMDLPGIWERVTPAVLERIATSVNTEAASVDDAKERFDADAARARSVAEAAIRRENARLAEELREKWPEVSPSDWFRLSRAGTDRLWFAYTEADGFIDDAEKLKSPWRANDALKAALAILARRESSSSDQLVDLAKLAAQYMPHSITAKSFANGFMPAQPSQRAGAFYEGTLGERTNYARPIESPGVLPKANPSFWSKLARIARAAHR